MQGRSNGGRPRGVDILLGLVLLAGSATTLAAKNPAHLYNFSGSGPSDIGIYQLNRFWWFQTSPSNLSSFPVGSSADQSPIPADFDGDGRTDFAVYSPSARTVTWVQSSDGTTQTGTYGDWGDIPVVGDFDGDGKTDHALYRPTLSIYWYTQSSNNELVSYQIGVEGDLPVVADFDGDGRDELGVYNPVNATFTFSLTSTGVTQNIQLGQPGDVPLVGDFDGDGKADLAVYHSPTSTFTYRRSSDGGIVAVQFGQHGDTPILGDYDGDGKTDVGVFRPQVGSYNIMMYLASSTGQTVTFDMGNPGVSPLGARYAPGEVDSTLTYTNSTGAMQTMYQSGVPHTNKNGVVRTTYDPAASFLPRCAVAALPGDLATLASAGFNCFYPYQNPGLTLPQNWNGFLAEAHQVAGTMQMVGNIQIPIPSGLPTSTNCNTYFASAISQMQAQINSPSTVTSGQTIAADSAILAWKGEDEPSGDATYSTCRLENFEALSTSVKQVDPVHPVLDVDLSAPSTGPLGTWEAWNAYPPVLANDNYPFGTSTLTTLANSAFDFHLLTSGIGRTVPAWIWLQTFSGTVGNFQWSMPTAAELRAEVFNAFVHGATGVSYFILDNFVARNNQVIGITATPLTIYPQDASTDLHASSSDITASAAAWTATVAENAELTRLQSVILSPTATLSYQVGWQGTPVSATPIRTLLKESSDGTYTLLVINIDNVPMNVQFTFPTRPVDLYKIDSLGGRNPLAPAGLTIQDSLAGFGVGIYEFK